MILGNNNVYARNPLRHFGGLALSQEQGNWGKTGAIRNFQVGWAALVSGTSINLAETSGLPVGYLHPFSWRLPQKPGGLSSRFYLNGSTNTAADISGGLNSSLTIAGTGQLENADLSLILEAFADLIGTSSISSSISGILEGQIDINGISTLTASLEALAFLIVDLTGTSNVTGSIDATGDIYCDITVTGDLLTTSNVGTAVWENFLAESGLSMKQAMQLIAAALSGELSGAGTSVITIKNAVAGDVDRIVAEVDGTGNRTSITYNI